MQPSVLITILFAFVSGNDSFTIDQQPPPSVKEGSIQTITWNTNLTLTQVSIDLYQNSRFIAKLGETTENSRNFAWKVGDNAPLGKNYLIKVSVMSSTKKTAWANTNTFEIVSSISWNKNYLFFLLLILLFVFCICNDKKRRTSTSSSLPYAQPAYTANPMYPTQSGTNNFSTGFLAGVATDEVLHAGNGTSWFSSQGGGGSNNDGFGGGDFGSSFFGGGGGDSSGGFS